MVRPNAGQVALDGSAERIEILVDTEEVLRFGLAQWPREPGRRRVDEHKVADVQQCVRVRTVSERRTLNRFGKRGIHLHWREAAHVQPHGRRTRPAIEQESHRPSGTAPVVHRIGDVEHARLGGAVIVTDGQVTRRDRVAQRPAAHRDRALFRLGVFLDACGGNIRIRLRGLLFRFRGRGIAGRSRRIGGKGGGGEEEAQRQQ